MFYYRSTRGQAYKSEMRKRHKKIFPTGQGINPVWLGASAAYVAVAVFCPLWYWYFKPALLFFAFVYWKMATDK